MVTRDRQSRQVDFAKELFVRLSPYASDFVLVKESVRRYLSSRHDGQHLGTFLPVSGDCDDKSKLAGSPKRLRDLCHDVKRYSGWHP